MLKRIYIDNFRCLVNFELNVDIINLFLGSNGAGKLTVFEVLQKNQLFISGDSKIESIFKSRDCTHWQISKIQRFELDILNDSFCDGHKFYLLLTIYLEIAFFLLHLGFNYPSTLKISERPENR
ncbi:ATPase-like protein [Calothrix sp. NIES-4071]|nr:ATPase-like protein [Calothrix sp. NIES-4071]BAZ64298.1 ATPase-like protein [Calothrix sp. NIES-4105]